MSAGAKINPFALVQTKFKLNQMKTQSEVRNSFWSMLQECNPKLASERRTRKRQNQYCADIRCSFVDYVDQLNKGGEISNSLANRVTL